MEGLGRVTVCTGTNQARLGVVDSAIMVIQFNWSPRGQLAQPGQSSGLLIRVSRVRIPDGPPKRTKSRTLTLRFILAL